MCHESGKDIWQGFWERRVCLPFRPHLPDAIRGWDSMILTLRGCWPRLMLLLILLRLLLILLWLLLNMGRDLPSVWARRVLKRGHLLIQGNALCGRNGWRFPAPRFRLKEDR